MRVLHLFDHAARRRNDYRRRSLALLGQLRTQGVQTVQLTAAPADRQAEVEPGVAHWPQEHDGHVWHFYRTGPPLHTCRRIGALANSLIPALSPALALGTLAWRLRQVTRLTRPDLIHVHTPTRHALAALPAARLLRLPLVVDAQRHAPDAGAVERWALCRADALAAGSAGQRASLRAQGLCAGRIAVIPPAPDLAPACAQVRAPAGLEGAPLIVYAGRLRREDGFDLLLAVLPALRRRFPALRLLVAGGGRADEAREDDLFERLHAPGLRGHVAVTGALACRRAADLLPRADIAVFPALPGPHALLPSRHLLNAMAQGCAIVASDIACHRDLLVHGHNGILFSAGSGVCLLDALVRLLGEPWRRPPLGQAAVDFVASQRSWEATAARYRRLYEAVLAAAGRRR
ncbi:glycosyltransferase family 4 protein [Massilia sp. 9096]|uniref:glycosyltransferase family 4 protein n=1 Tax=Massilia sp. 9096 TaxID=1500894 RepID=UPI000565D76B|nr:glycosyltransferase [Massilia sp. 9096]